MTVLAPIWLLLLAPWTVLTWWVLTRRATSTTVPFVELWRTTDTSPSRPAPRQLHRQPLPVLLLLLAALLGVLATARPAIRSKVGLPITIVLDRGVTMSSRAIDLRSVTDRLTREYGDCEVDSVSVPGNAAERMKMSEWRARIVSERATGLDTSSLLPTTIRSCLRTSGDQPILVITNQAITVDDPRVAAVVPPTTRPAQNVGFVRVGARRSPKPAVMARVRNRSDATRAGLHVSSAGQTIVRAIELPPNGQERDYFVDLEKIGQTLAFELRADGPDDFAADDRAWLVQARAWPKLEATGALPPALARMIELYSKHRPPGDASPRVAVGVDERQVPADRPMVVLDIGQSSTDLKSGLVVAAHPITSGMAGWDVLLRDVQIAEAPTDGWTPILSVGANALVAVRNEPVRQVHVSFWSDAFARSPQFVIFWTNVFDWLAGDAVADEFTAEPVHDLGDGWTRDETVSGPATTAEPSPGVSVEPGGRMVAMNAIDLPTPIERDRVVLPKSVWTEESRSATELSPGLAVAAALAIAGAVATFGRRRERPGSSLDLPS